MAVALRPEGEIVMRILIADDDPISAKVLASTLTPDAFDVTIAHDGAQALEILRRPDSPPIAILDWMMPHLEGPEVCRLLRADAARARRYLILLTSRDAREDVVAGLDAGADDYLVKPFHQGELRARVSVGARVLALQEGLAARVEELRTALADVKQLSGLLPICSYCKAIRSDENYWQQVEGYVMQHSDAQFTHGVCPPCFAEISKELADLSKKGGPKGRLSI
jgi:sigma-B regulation protein RsbU (phosphoserine phosphatase)